MTSLSRNNMKVSWKTAGRSFTAMCGHRIQKGERYHVFDDYFAYRSYHVSQCERCADGKKEDSE